MGLGPVKVFTGLIASGASTSSGIKLDRVYSRVFLQVPSMTTQAAIDVWGSSDDTTYYQVYERVNTAPVQYQSLIVGTNCSNALVPLDVHFSYVQFRTSAVVSGGATFTMHCTD